MKLFYLTFLINKDWKLLLLFGNSHFTFFFELQERKQKKKKGGGAQTLITQVFLIGKP